LSLFELRQPTTRRHFESHSNTVGAAAHLGMNRATLVFRMKKFGIYAKSTFDLQPGFLSLLLQLRQFRRFPLFQLQHFRRLAFFS
jgi:hypothetical protein